MFLSDIPYIFVLGNKKQSRTPETPGRRKGDLEYSSAPKVVKKHGRNKLFPKLFDMISGSKNKKGSS